MQVRICDPKIAKEVVRLASAEKRSLVKQVEALLAEAIAARQLNGRSAQPAAHAR